MIFLHSMRKEKVSLECADYDRASNGVFCILLFKAKFVNNVSRIFVLWRNGFDGLDLGGPKYLSCTRTFFWQFKQD